MQGTIAFVSLSLFKILGINKTAQLPGLAQSSQPISRSRVSPVSGAVSPDYVLELLVEVVHGRKPLYLGLQAATKKEPLTYYDMNLSAQVTFLREEVI